MKFTHDTKDCSRWDANSNRVSHKTNAKIQCANHYAKVQKERDKMSKCFAQMCEDHMALMKKIKKDKKKSKKKDRYASSSSDSDSS